jgi:hypothetical protein
MADSDTLSKLVERKFDRHNDAIRTLPSEGLFDAELHPYRAGVTPNKEARYYPVEELALYGALLLVLSRIVLPDERYSAPTIAYEKNGFSFVELPWNQDVTLNEDGEWVYGYSKKTHESYTEKIHPVRKHLLIAGVALGRPHKI